MYLRACNSVPILQVCCVGTELFSSFRSPFSSSFMASNYIFILHFWYKQINWCIDERHWAFIYYLVMTSMAIFSLMYNYITVLTLLKFITLHLLSSSAEFIQFNLPFIANALLVQRPHGILSVTVYLRTANHNQPRHRKTTNLQPITMEDRFFFLLSNS